MPIFIKENQELNGRKFVMPKEVLDHLKTTLSTYGQYKDNDGYKRLNSLINPKYNNHNEKESQEDVDDGRHISYTDMKRMDFDFRKIPNNPQNLSFILNGGSVMKDWVQNSLKQARNSVKPTLKKKKSDNIKKSMMNHVKNPMKPIKMDNDSSLHIHESKSKKIYVNEDQLKKLYEYRDQMVLPFDGDGRKMNYQHFIDWIEHVGKAGQLPKSTITFEQAINQNLDSALEQYEDFSEEESSKPMTIKRMKNILYDTGFMNELTFNDRNLVYIERNIKLPNLTDKSYNHNIQGNVNYDLNDYFQFLNKRYGNGIGTFWSWKVGNGDVYNGLDNFNDGTTVKIKAWVRLDDIYWGRTLMKNIYDLRYETEIQVLNGSFVEVFEITTLDGKKLPLNKTMLIKA